MIVNDFLKARRYFRLVKWIDCFGNVQVHFSSRYGSQAATKGDDGASVRNRNASSNDDLRFTLVVSKWSLYGIYYFVEMFTIVCSAAAQILDADIGPSLTGDGFFFP